MKRCTFTKRNYGYFYKLPLSVAFGPLLLQIVISLGTHQKHVHSPRLHSFDIQLVTLYFSHINPKHSSRRAVDANGAALTKAQKRIIYRQHVSVINIGWFFRYSFSARIFKHSSLKKLRVKNAKKKRSNSSKQSFDTPFDVNVIDDRVAPFKCKVNRPLRVWSV